MTTHWEYPPERSMSSSAVALPTRIRLPGRALSVGAGGSVGVRGGALCTLELAILTQARRGRGQGLLALA